MRNKKITTKEKREKRFFASKHCIHYDQCLNEAAKNGKTMYCYKCEKIEIVHNNYQKGVDKTSISNNIEEYPLRIDYNKIRIT